jgi:hypothetical protein
MNLTSFASGIDIDAGEELPWDKPPRHHSFIAENIMPFATNMQVQVMTCGGLGGEAEEDGEGDDDWGEREDVQEEQGDVEQMGQVKRGWWPFGHSSEDDEDDDEDDSTDSTPTYAKHKSPTSAGRYVRIVLNDAVVPLTGINGCAEDDDGKCAFDAFVDGMKEVIGRVDFARDCGARDKEPGMGQEQGDGAEPVEAAEGNEGDDGDDGDEVDNAEETEAGEGQ